MGFKHLQLPSVRILKDYVDANIEDAGECMKRLEEERKLYLAMIEQKQQDLVDRKEGLLCGIHTIEMFILYFPFSEHKVLPTGDRVMITDEVNVIFISFKSQY